MAKIRAVLIELEGADATVLSAIRSVVNRDEPEQAAIAPAPVEIPKQIEAPAAAAAVQEVEASPAVPKTRQVRKQAKRQKTQAAQSGAEPAREAKSPVTGGCRAEVHTLLKGGPKTSSELVKALSQYSAASVYLALKELRGAMVVKTVQEGSEQLNTLQR